MQPQNSYVAFNYDALRQLISNEQLQAVIQKSWPEPSEVGW